ncbi:MAG TPA: alginate lyase family protein [Polyangia bacterium]|jgi:hypothetical protein|nr:alginate lyase family protein [Polyangia bacterium]
MGVGARSVQEVRDRLSYWRTLLGVVPAHRVLRAVVHRALDPPRYRCPRSATAAEARAAAAALAARPRLFPFSDEEMRAVYEEALPGEAARAVARAEAALRQEIEVFGTPVPPGAGRAWHVDFSRGQSFAPAALSESIDFLQAGRDPKWPWELARGAHLLLLGVGARLAPDLRAEARRAMVEEIASFLADNPLGEGVHWTSPLEVALRALHWLAALELVGGDGPADFRRRLGGALIEHGRFLAVNLEDRGLVPANHLIGDLLGLLVMGTALDGVAEAGAWRRAAIRGLEREAERQVLPDGADFEASTSYHRFTLELLLAADRVARAARLPLALGPTLRRMFRFVAGYLGPDGYEPAFGDSDEGRVLPMAPYPPRYQAYLLSVGGVRHGEATLRRPGAAFSAEAAWLGGLAGWRRWRALGEFTPPASESFPTGGLHVLRSDRLQVVLRCGGYGQQGVGGHAHNDQLSLAVWLDGAPLIVDPGTHCYAADPAWRDHLRGTAAHATVTVEAAEQSPIYDGRMFALPDAARAVLDELVDEGESARLVAHHRGYRRLPCRATHHREVLLDRRRTAVLVRDTIEGKGTAAVEAYYPFGEAEVRPLTQEELARLRIELQGAPWLAGTTAMEGVAVLRDERPLAALLTLGDDGANAGDSAPSAPRPQIRRSWWAPGYGQRRPAMLVCIGVHAPLPITCRVLLVSFPGRA